MDIEKGEYYKGGFRTGIDWGENYTPGGPRVYYPQSFDDDEWKERCKISLNNNIEWHKGFKDGVLKQRRINSERKEND